MGKRVSRVPSTSTVKHESVRSSALAKIRVALDRLRQTGTAMGRELADRVVQGLPELREPSR